MAQRIISTPQVTDPGTEGLIGYDYQRDIAARLCIKTLKDQHIQYIVCEFHNDLVQINDENRLQLIQVKKTQSKNWTLGNLIKPSKRQKQGILAKLLEPLQTGKDISGLCFWGHGKPSASKEDGNISLVELMALLNTPQKSRDGSWNSRIEKYIGHIGKQLEKQGINLETVKRGIQLLSIKLDHPHPDAIDKENCDLLAQILKDVWAIELTTEEVRLIYNDVCERIKQISHQPLQPWTVKAVSRPEMVELVLKRAEQFSPAANRETTLTTQEKLTRVELQTKTKYAFQKRLNAMILRHEASISSAEWQKYRTKIDIRCRSFRKMSPASMGPDLWKGLIEIFSDLGEEWKKEKNDPRFGYDFVEGVFFDMTGVCEVQWMRTNGEKP